MSRKVYPADVSDEEWEFVAPYLILIREDAGQRVHALREVFDAVRWMVKPDGRGGCYPATSRLGKRWSSRSYAG